MTVVLKKMLIMLFLLSCLASHGAAMQRGGTATSAVKPNVPVLNVAATQRLQFNASGSSDAHAARERDGEAQWGPATARRHQAPASASAPSSAAQGAPGAAEKREASVDDLMISVHRLRLRATAQVAEREVNIGRFQPPAQERPAEKKGWHCYVHNERAILAAQYIDEHGRQVFYAVQNLCSGLGYCVFWTGTDDGWVSGTLSYGAGGLLAAHALELKKWCEVYINHFWVGCYHVETSRESRSTQSDRQPLTHDTWCWGNKYSCGVIENGCGVMLLQGDDGLWYDATLRLEFNDTQQAWWAKATLFEKKDCGSCSLQAVCSECQKQEVLERARRVMCAFQPEAAGKNKVGIRQQFVRRTAAEGWQTQKSVAAKELSPEMSGFFEAVFCGEMISYFEQVGAVSRVEL